MGEDAEGEEPGADHDQDSASPAFQVGRVRPERLDDALLSGRDGVGEREHERDDGEGGEGKGEQCCVEAAEGDGVSGQTDQDRPGSAEAGREVAEPEQREPELWPLPAELGCRVEEAVCGLFEPAERNAKCAELFQPEQE